eukprot:TRINITY_DN19181_c0_g1_i1.p1 TRINITY_DN19181_c0_g1~~TRINITY_DN19181_c0_g1_i1.p1  ORF type:complete len:463 (+),score=63.47 TRINITY_DN19181_c0_g1_i1:412-1800(+)
MYCHVNHVIHRDVKPENILISKNGILKLCDFGFARTMGGQGTKYTDYVATRWYRSPELLVGDVEYKESVDIWAVGCMTAEISTGIPLFPGESDIDQLHHIIRCFGRLTTRQLSTFKKNPLYSGLGLPDQHTAETLEKRLAGSITNKQLLQLLKVCLNIEPERRWTCAELLNHPYFTQHGYPSHDVTVREEKPVKALKRVELEKVETQYQNVHPPVSPKAGRSSGNWMRKEKNGVDVTWGNLFLQQHKVGGKCSELASELLPPEPPAQAFAKPAMSQQRSKAHQQLAKQSDHLVNNLPSLRKTPEPEPVCEKYIPPVHPLAAANKPRPLVPMVGFPSQGTPTPSPIGKLSISPKQDFIRGSHIHSYFKSTALPNLSSDRLGTGFDCPTVVLKNERRRNGNKEKKILHSTSTLARTVPKFSYPMGSSSFYKKGAPASQGSGLTGVLSRRKEAKPMITGSRVRNS